MSPHREVESTSNVNDNLHAISFCRECIDDKFLDHLFPFPHLRVGIDNRFDVLEYIFLLSLLLMKRNLQRIEDTSYVNLRTASHAYMYVRKFQFNEFFDELQDLFAG